MVDTTSLGNLDLSGDYGPLFGHQDAFEGGEGVGETWAYFNMAAVVVYEMPALVGTLRSLGPALSNTFTIPNLFAPAMVTAEGVVVPAVIEIAYAEALAVTGIASLFTTKIDWDIFDEFDDNLNSFEKMAEGHNTAQNKKAQYIADQVGLNKAKARQLHDAIMGKGYPLEEIWNIARQLLGR